MGFFYPLYFFNILAVSRVQKEYKKSREENFSGFTKITVLIKTLRMAKGLLNKGRYSLVNNNEILSFDFAYLQHHHRLFTLLLLHLFHTLAVLYRHNLLGYSLLSA